MSRTGRPRKLTPEQESKVYAESTSARYGRRCFVHMRLARELQVSVPTLERVVKRRQAQQLTEIANKFHENHQNSTSTG